MSWLSYNIVVFLTYSAQLNSDLRNPKRVARHNDEPLFLEVSSGVEPLYTVLQTVT